MSYNGRVKIKNFAELAASELRRSALSIIEAGLEAIDTGSVIRKNVSLAGSDLIIADEAIPLNSLGRVVVVGAGKCALEAAAALEEVLGDRISGGAIIDVREGNLNRIKALSGDHPLPTERNVDAAKGLIAALRGLTERDLVIAIVSGGGSVLLSLPEKHSVAEEARIFRALTKAGADITELNTIRKHTSLARGGHLAKYAHPARVACLIFSDVPGDPLQFISSGPTVKDTTSVADAERVLEKYGGRAALELEDLEFSETPKEDEWFEKVRNTIVVSGRTALAEMFLKAGELGYQPRIAADAFHGEARGTGERIAQELREAPPGTALLYAGESTVLIRGGGKGGRNQEVALSALRTIAAGELVAAIASDGRDNTEFAGALCDIISREKAAGAGLDPGKFLAANDSFHFWEPTGDLIFTGPTGSNVSDLILAIKEKQK